MSQQKYASNVVEKCLTFGTPKERQVLINEILGSTDENEPLQVLTDAFSTFNYSKKSNRYGYNCVKTKPCCNLIGRL